MELLPEEILVDIFELLPRSAQGHMALVNHLAYRLVTPIMYRQITFTDCPNPSTNDEHDDTPMIRMLILFVQNPILASHVRELTHQCHLLLPDWTEIPSLSYCKDNRSKDSRTHCLLQRAILNLVSVQTLIIVMGHDNIVRGLLQGFFDPHRASLVPVRRLWVESSCLRNNPWPRDVPQGLQSIRLRRLGLLSSEADAPEESRPPSRLLGGDPVQDPTALDSMIAKMEDQIFDKLKDYVSPELLRMCASSSCLYCPHLAFSRSASSLPFFMGVVKSEQLTLTSINFDWILNGEAVYAALISTKPTFPHLKALQVRNAVKDQAVVVDPRNLDRQSYLLNSVWLSFLQRHPDIECLAWPMAYFIHTEPGKPAVVSLEASQALTRLGQQLKLLRVDSPFFRVDNNTDLELAARDPELLKRQRIFVNLVAPEMKSLKVIKVEGTVPAEVRRDILEKLSSCPLEKVVIIGIHWTIGNSWTASIDTVKGVEISKPVSWETLDFDSDEDSEAEANSSSLEALSRTQSSTITELKFCGFYGSPVLHDPSPRTSTQLSYLRHFHNLHFLTTAFWLSTNERGLQCSQHIYHLWDGSIIDTEGLTELGREEQIQIQREVEPYYNTANLAEQVAKIVGPHLSDQALSRKSGVGVKALFLLVELEPDDRSEIFELQIFLGKNGKVIHFGEIMGENHPGKLAEKMRRRGWF
jgi:hypothetical protein